MISENLLNFSGIGTIAGIATITATIVAIITYVYGRKKFRLTTLLEAFRLLNDTKHKEAHKVLYDNISHSSFDILGVNREKANSDDLRGIAATIVRSDFNEIATLAHHKLIDEKIFVREYWWIVLRVWFEIEAKIKERRTHTGPTNYMET
jgi:hypothetical protein